MACRINDSSPIETQAIGTKTVSENSPTPQQINAQQYAEHVAQLCTRYKEALELPDCQSLAAVLLHSGSEHHYYGDDRGVPFQAFGHFCHWLPVNRPDQFLLIRPDQRPVYFQVVPSDFWYDQHIDNAPWWAEQFDIVQLASVSELAAQLPNQNLAYLGESARLARELGLATEHGENESSDCKSVTALRNYLDYHRACKSLYEITQLQSAAQRALHAHEVAHDAFLAGGSEYGIHMAYLAACEAQEHETPYTNIVAINEKAAILHYQHKRSASQSSNAVLLIDAGCRVNNYGSDITRTTASEAAHPVFHHLLQGMQQLELDIVAAVRPGISYVSLHEQALRGVAALLTETGICNATSDEMMAMQLPQLFMPHGVGHLLGIQVHDVGGHQADFTGTRLPPPAHSPALRNTRTLCEDMVFTIEPGLYFIPLLLEAERNSERGRTLNWPLIDALYYCGGIRIEDNVLVTAEGYRNLSRVN